ncbi:MAG: cob(I)yrinic acid a,c-diamide adenosyltransferase [Candidatus Heimdallarchaeota archaeon]
MNTQLEKGLIQVYFGQGKGKTTAALGLAFRAVGRGLRVHMIQFMKGYDYGELHAVKASGLFEITQFGSPDFVSEATQMDLEMGKEGLEFAKKIIMEGEYDIVILDEIGMAIEHSIIDVNDVLELLDNKSNEIELILTGARMHPKLLERADLITEMRLVKHPYSTHGLGPRLGIEY